MDDGQDRAAGAMLHVVLSGPTGLVTACVIGIIIPGRLGVTMAWLSGAAIETYVVWSAWDLVRGGGDG